jgi:hypothetical protein
MTSTFTPASPGCTGDAHFLHSRPFYERTFYGRPWPAKRGRVVFTSSNILQMAARKKTKANIKEMLKFKVQL